jgi:hypothetical protein
MATPMATIPANPDGGVTASLERRNLTSILLIETFSGANSGIQFAGTSTGAPFFLTKNTKTFAGFVPLAFRPTMWTSSVPS